MLCASPWGTFPFLSGDGGGVGVDRLYGKGEGMIEEEGGETAFYVK